MSHFFISTYMSACNEISGDITGTRKGESFLIAFFLIRLKSVL